MVANPLAVGQLGKAEPSAQVWQEAELGKQTHRPARANGHHLSESLGQALGSNQKLECLAVDSAPSTSSRQLVPGKQQKGKKGKGSGCWPFRLCCG